MEQAKVKATQVAGVTENTIRGERKQHARTKSNWLDPKTTAENEKLPWYFKWAWTSRGLSLAVNAILIMQLTYYCTDMLGMPAALVGTLLLASKIFDGFTDIVVGFIIDRTHTKLGKARPYEIFIIFVWLFTILLFSAPNLGTTGLAVYVFVMYTLINSICATFLNGGDAVYLARSVRSEKNRVSVMSFNGALIMVSSIVFSVLLPQLIAGIGSTRAGWTTIAASIGIPLAIIGLFRFIFIKEVVDINPGSSTKKAAPIPLKKSLSCVMKNRYLWILAGMTLVVQLSTNVGTSVGTYYFKYIIGNIGLQSLISLSGIITPVIMAVFPLLAAKLGTVRLIRIGAVLGVIGYAIRIIGGTNLVTLTAGSLITGISVLPITLMISIYLIDCMDYGEWKTGTRVEGFIASVNSFCSKLGSGLASGLVGLLMGMTGYDGALAVQPAAANAMIQFLFNWMPLILTVIMLILAILYNVDKLMPKIHADLQARHQADAQ